MTKIKICGLKRKSDALAAVEYGADALGFVFAPISKRIADPRTVAEIVREVGPYTVTVGVFRDQPAEEVARIMETTGLSTAQLHGSESAAYMDSLPFPCYKSISMGSEDDLALLDSYPGRGFFLLDTGTGGTGMTFDWNLAVKAGEKGRIILAGGLGPANVAQAIRTVAPYAVDVCSGIEKDYGIKDHVKIREFIMAARLADIATAPDAGKEPQ